MNYKTACREFCLKKDLFFLFSVINRSASNFAGFYMSFLLQHNLNIYTLIINLRKICHL